jgi:hypothetical protein
MKRSSLCAIVLLALLAGLIAVPPAAAEPRRQALSGLASVLERLWSFVSIFQAKNGCILDPNGVRHCEPASAATTKNGCQIDPDGVRRCDPASATPTTENGCRIDPDGACRQ